MARRDDVDPGLPIKLHPCSNGEFVPLPPGPVAAEATRVARAEAGDRARRLGMSRRRFLLSSMGAAAGLLVLDACSKESGKATGQGSPSGSFTVPPEASADAGAAQSAVGGTEAILDVQTHLLDYELVPEGPDFWSGFPYKNCGEAEQRDCFGVDHWMEELFLRSDTAMVVLSAVPIVGDADPLSIDVMERARRVATQLCGDGRVLLQGHAVPNVGRIDAALDGMRQLHASHPIAAWKVYTHAPGPGWSFTDDTGEAFLSRSRRSRRRVARASSRSTRGSRAAIRPRRRSTSALPRWPTPTCASSCTTPATNRRTRKPRLPTNGRGVDRLVRSLRDAGIRPGGNVYAELGSTWRAVMGDPDQAAARARQAPRRGGRGQRPLGYRLDLVRLAAGPDPGVPHVRAHGGVAGTIRLSRR